MLLRFLKLFVMMGMGISLASVLMASDSPSSVSSPVLATRLTEDPSEEGLYTVKKLDYRLGHEAIALRGMRRDLLAELAGVIYYPVDKTSPSPVVVFLHGSHSVCPGRKKIGVWPCEEYIEPIPSYRGYAQPAQALASHGYIVVSISANAINAYDMLTTSYVDDYPEDYGAGARGQLVLDTLDLLSGANAGTERRLSPALMGRFDFSRIGLMGHSRGGEGIIHAARLNSARQHPYSIQALMLIAATNGTRVSLPAIPTVILLPYCDGDVQALDGQRYLDDARYSHADSVLRSSVLIMGANHNFFNSVWTPSEYPEKAEDDWTLDSRQGLAHCRSNEPTRLSASEQRQVGSVYITGFFRLILGRETPFIELFDGSQTSVASISQADIRVTPTFPRSNRLDIIKLSRLDSQILAEGSSSAVLCGGPGDEPCTLGRWSSEQIPHWAEMGIERTGPWLSTLLWYWDSAESRLRLILPESSRDVLAYRYLSIKMAPGEETVQNLDMTLTVVDRFGASQSFSVNALSRALTVLPGTAAPLKKMVLQNVFLPVLALTSVDKQNISEIRLTPAASHITGSVYLAEVAFVTLGVREPD